MNEATIMNTSSIPAPDPAAVKKSQQFKLIGKVIWGLVTLYVAYTIYLLFAAGEIGLGLFSSAFLALVIFVFTQKRAYTYRYLFPGLAAFSFFIIFPIAYTFLVSFENYKETNLLTYDLAQKYFLSETVVDGEQKYAFKMVESGNNTYQVQLTNKSDSSIQFLSEPFAMQKGQEVALSQASSFSGKAVPLKTVVQNRNTIKEITLVTPEGNRFSMTGLREFAPRVDLYKAGGDGILINNITGEKLTADFDTGFYRKDNGEALTPGFRVNVGMENYNRIFGDPAYLGPFAEIFIWTVSFAFVTVALTLAVGMTLGVLLSWESLKFRAVYRVLLILPYAVPSFLSILIFKGLFNENFGEINTILYFFFGIKPHWFTDTATARTMIFIVNTWLGFPYFMILTLGLVQSIPKSLYEAATIDGSGPINNYLKITVPLIIKPLTPLIISSFAFNFNNFNLIFLLTRGKPDMIGTAVPAGTTDLLVSYSYRVAFLEGLDLSTGSAISTVIFVCIGILAVIQLKASNANEAVKY